MLIVEQKAPNFTLPDKDGNMVSLSDLQEKGCAVFYPKDNTPGCVPNKPAVIAMNTENLQNRMRWSSALVKTA